MFFRNVSFAKAKPRFSCYEASLLFRLVSDASQFSGNPGAGYAGGPYYYYYEEEEEEEEEAVAAEEETQLEE